MLPIVARWKDVTSEILGPAFSQAPSRRGTIRSAGTLVRVSGCRLMFRNDVLRNVFAGIGAHSALPLESPGSSAVAWALMGAAHAAGWPIVRGGSQRISDALALYLSTLDGRIVTNHRVDCLDSFTNQLVLCDVTPRLLLGMARNTLPDQFCRTLREYRYGPGIFKVDWALDGPIPWRAPDCLRAATVHLGGTWNEVSASEASAWTGRICEKPFVILTQPSLFDHTRTHQGMPGRIAIYRTDRPWT